MHSHTRSVNILLCALLLSYSSFAQSFERKGDVVTYRGNKFTYTPVGKVDTITVTDPVTQKKVRQYVPIDPKPVRMNGAKIFYTEEMTWPPVPYGGEGAVERGILKGLQADLNKLPDGKYYLDLFNIITDTKGRIVYYEYNGLLAHSNKMVIPASVKSAVDKKIDSVVNTIPSFKPGRANGTNVVARTDVFLNFYTIEVKKHKAVFKKK